MLLKPFNCFLKNIELLFGPPQAIVKCRGIEHELINSRIWVLLEVVLGTCLQFIYRPLDLAFAGIFSKEYPEIVLRTDMIMPFILTKTVKFHKLLT